MGTVVGVCGVEGVNGSILGFGFSFLAMVPHKRLIEVMKITIMPSAPIPVPGLESGAEFLLIMFMAMPTHIISNPIMNPLLYHGRLIFT